MTTDESVRSEVAVPVAGADDALLVLDAEFIGRVFTAEEAEAVQAEAARLEAELVAVSRSGRSPRRSSGPGGPRRA